MLLRGSVGDGGVLRGAHDALCLPGQRHRVAHARPSPVMAAVLGSLRALRPHVGLSHAART
eukprot:5520861-Alexandrium_andersonii.AAC.1